MPTCVSSRFANCMNCISVPYSGLSFPVPTRLDPKPQKELTVDSPVFRVFWSNLVGAAVALVPPQFSPYDPVLVLNSLVHSSAELSRMMRAGLGPRTSRASRALPLVPSSKSKMPICSSGRSEAYEPSSA